MSVPFLELADAVRKVAHDGRQDSVEFTVEGTELVLTRKDALAEVIEKMDEVGGQ